MVCCRSLLSCFELYRSYTRISRSQIVCRYFEFVNLLEFLSSSKSSLISVPFTYSFLFLLQLDADREEEEVFGDISMTLDNKLFPSCEPAAGETPTGPHSLESWKSRKSIMILKTMSEGCPGLMEPQPKISAAVSNSVLILTKCECACTWACVRACVHVSMRASLRAINISQRSDYADDII